MGEYSTRSAFIVAPLLVFVCLFFKPSRVGQLTIVPSWSCLFLRHFMKNSVWLDRKALEQFWIFQTLSGSHFALEILQRSRIFLVIFHPVFRLGGVHLTSTQVCVCPKQFHSIECTTRGFTSKKSPFVIIIALVSDPNIAKSSLCS